MDLGLTGRVAIVATASKGLAADSLQECCCRERHFD